MSVELLAPLRPPELWEVEEPYPRRFSLVEQDLMEAGGLEPGRRGWSCEQYHDLGDLGVLGPEERVQLVGGEILQMSPQRSYHSAAVSFAARILTSVFGPGLYVRQQQPIQNPPVDEPEPDVAVVAGAPEDYVDAHPTTALLIVEVSDSTLRFDLGKKASLYATFGIADYWVVDLRNQRVDVHRSPIPSPEAEYGHTYGDRRTYDLDEGIEPLGAAGSQVLVRELIPMKGRRKR